MRIERKPDGIEIICETPDDWKSTVVCCALCGAVHAYGPDTSHGKWVRREFGPPPDGSEFAAIQFPGCSRCTKELPAPSGQVFLGMVSDSVPTTSVN